MFMHNKRLQYTVRVAEPNPVLASLLLEQFGGPDGELAAAMRYFTQGLAEEDPGRKDLLLDIATEELSHLEVIGSIVAMLNRGAKAELAEASMTEAELYMSLTAGGNSHTQSILYGGGPALTNSSGVPWTAAYVDSRGDPAVDLRSNIAAESRAKIVYERLINREIAHQKSFEKALYSIDDNFPAGKLPGVKPYTDMYVNASQGDGDAEGPWNSGEQWDRVDDVEGNLPLDGGDGTASVGLTKAQEASLAALKSRLASDPSKSPVTGADLGAGPGSGRMSDEDMGGADDIEQAAEIAKANDKT
jgi:Mn-containing catalase